MYFYREVSTISTLKGPQYQLRPWGHNIKHVHGTVISILYIWSQYQHPLILWPHVSIQNLAESEHWYYDPMDHWYCAHVTGPRDHNINAIDIVSPCLNPKLSQILTIDIMTTRAIDIVLIRQMVLATVSMPLILRPHVQIQNLAKIVPLILWPHGTLILWLVFGVTISMTKKPQYQWLITLQFTTKFYYLT